MKKKTQKQLMKEYKERNDREELRIKARKQGKKRAMEKNKMPAESKDVTMISKADMKDPMYIRFLQEMERKNKASTKRTALNRAKK